MDAIAILNTLANLLEMRRQAPTKYNLLLTSEISLTPSILRSICGSDNWSTFRTYMQQRGLHDRIYSLAPLLHTAQHQAGYQALARLIIKGYFGTILTTNLDSALEDALFEAGTKTVPIQTLILDRDGDEHIIRMLEADTDAIRIVKLHGSLRDGVLPDRFPDFFEMRAGIRESVSRYLNQDIIIVGSLEHEYDIERAMIWNNKRSIYYAQGKEAQDEDSIYKLIRARGGDPEQRMIAGQYGSADVFFTTLENLIEKNISRPSELPPAQIEQQREHITSQPQKREPENQALKADVLLITVTDVETDAVFNALQAANGQTYERCFIGDKTYYNLGRINGARIFLVESQMGTGGPGGSLLTASEGIRALAPLAVVMVGIAFGMERGKQHIGDVLVSLQLRSYEQQRYGSKTDGSARLILRGDLASASTRLIDRFRSGNKDWTGQARIAFGLILSGEKVVDNKDFRDQLRTLEPEALGGEMEGAGLYAVAQRYKVDWILVKAICDWADGNKSQNKARNQKKAAENAAQFTIHVLQQTKFY